MKDSTAMSGCLLRDEQLRLIRINADEGEVSSYMGPLASKKIWAGTCIMFAGIAAACVFAMPSLETRALSAPEKLLTINTNFTESLSESAAKADLADVVSQVRSAVVPWAATKTQYSFKTFFCGGGERFTQCGPFSDKKWEEDRRRSGPSARRRAGCVDDCKVFKTDCSGFLRWSLIAGTRRRNNRVYDKLKDSMRRREEQRRRSDRVAPLAMDFYVAFKTVKPDDPWEEIRNFKDAKPGDVLAERYKDYKTGTTGHVMLVTGLPKFNKNLPKGRKEYTIQIADSGNSGHARDSRDTCTNGKCGVGFGDVHFEVYSSGLIAGFQWSAGNRRRRGGYKHGNSWALGRFTR